MTPEDEDYVMRRVTPVIIQPADKPGLGEDELVKVTPPTELVPQIDEAFVRAESLDFLREDLGG